MLCKSLHVLGLAMGVGAVFFACSDDPAPAGTSTNTDGGANPPGTNNPDGGGTNTDGSTPGPNPEPTCTPTTGAPTWTMHAAVIPDWNGKKDEPLSPHILGMQGLAYGNATWVMMAGSVGMDHLTWATSTDATTWSEKTQPLTGIKITNVRGLIYDGKRFLFIAGHDDGNTYAYTSPDAGTWTSVKVANGGNSVAGIVSTGDTAVLASGAGKIFTTTDFTTWADHSPGSGGFLDLAVGGGHFVGTAVGGDWVSPDGITWTKIAVDVQNNLDYGKGAFHARGSSEQKSTDGTTWTDEPQTGTGFGVTNGAKPYFIGNRFLQTQIDFTTGKSQYSASDDGAAWADFGKDDTGLPTPAGQGVFPLFMVYGGCHYLAAGNAIQNDSSVEPYVVVANASAAP